jgi:hypothetical protein
MPHLRSGAAGAHDGLGERRGDAMRFAQAFADELLPHHEREHLRAACDVLLDQFYEDIRYADWRHWSVTSLAMREYLPRHYLPRFTPRHAIEFHVCLVSVVWKLGQEHWQFPACLAEELALRALLEVARGKAEMQGHKVDYGAFTDAAFTDRDVEYLFRPGEDGIEESAVGTILGIGSLSLKDWTDQYGDGSVVHPYLWGDRDAPELAHGPERSDEHGDAEP